MTFDDVIICCLFGVSVLNYGNWNQKIVLSAENIIDTYQNEHELWNPELNGSEEAKEQACETVVCAVLMARLQVASHPDRMTPFPVLDFIQKNCAAAKYYRRACQNYSFVNIICHFQLQHIHLRQSLTTNGFVFDYVSDNVSDLSWPHTDLSDICLRQISDKSAKWSLAYTQHVGDHRGPRWIVV